MPGPPPPARKKQLNVYTNQSFRRQWGIVSAFIVGSAGVHYYYYKNYLEEKPDKFSDSWFRSKQDTKQNIWAVQVWDSIMPSWLSLGTHNESAARQEKFDQYWHYNKARGMTSGQSRGIKTSFQEGVILRQKEELLNTVDSIAENPTEVQTGLTPDRRIVVTSGPKRPSE